MSSYAAATLINFNKGKKYTNVNVNAKMLKLYNQKHKMQSFQTNI